MGFTMAPLLMHSEGVPSAARDALKAAALSPPERRKAALEWAARVLHHETDLDCGEARDLVGLPAGGC
jgi:hypothetical protein